MSLFYSSPPSFVRSGFRQETRQRGTSWVKLRNDEVTSAADNNGW